MHLKIKVLENISFWTWDGREIPLQNRILEAWEHSTGVIGLLEEGYYHFITANKNVGWEPYFEPGRIEIAPPEPIKGLRALIGQDIQTLHIDFK